MSDYVPNIFGGMTEFAACNASTEAVVADTDRLVLECIREVVLAFGHGADEDTDAFTGSQTLDVVFHSNDRSVKAEGHFPAVRRKMVGDRILDDLQ